MYTCFTSLLSLSPRRKNETGFSIETLCHDPSMPLYGVMLDDYNSSTCVMKEKNTTSGMAHFCSCNGEDECNDVLLFSPSEYTKLACSNEVKAALINIFISTLDQLTVGKVKGVTILTNPQRIVSALPHSSVVHFSIFQLIVLVLRPTTVLVQSLINCVSRVPLELSGYSGCRIIIMLLLVGLEWRT